ncbi:MAG: ATP-NAD kinase family protein [Spirochaetales bacterium]|nr:ATP-NAD kinase family protein [Spirochaetales bacterium]
MSRKKLGLIVNPVAGLGGRVGLKGSDGPEVWKKALALGAVPESPARAIRALERFADLRDSLELITYPAEMGEQEARAGGFAPTVIGAIHSGATTPQDTERAATDMAAQGVELILFAGGDGTARDIHRAVGRRLPVLGIPGGVKIHSGVFAASPAHAGDIARLFVNNRSTVPLREAEVMDIDEEAFRADRLSARLYGYLTIPYRREHLQGSKAGSSRGEAVSFDEIASEVILAMQPGILYIIGPGTTTRPILEKLGLSCTLLGVDAVLDRKSAGKDLSEAQILAALEKREARIVVTVIGGQGYILGRGNQQISPRVIRKAGPKNIQVVAAEEKLLALGDQPLRVDTGDPDLDGELCGYIPVIVGLNRRRVCAVIA